MKRFEKLNHKHAALQVKTVTYQPLVSGIDDGVQHRLIEEAVAHPLWDDDVDLLYWKFHLLHLPFDDCHDWKTFWRSIRHYNKQFMGILIWICVGILTVVKLVSLDDLRGIVRNATALNLYGTKEELSRQSNQCERHSLTLTCGKSVIG